MKKLMMMLGAVAMSFGLFADATPFAISFEQAEQTKGTYGVDVSTMKFTPPSGWTWTGEPLTLKAYAATGEEGYAYGEGAQARRDGFFEDQGDANANYLDLSTGSDELKRTVGEGNVFLDQTVKFTGFEDAPTELGNGTKIAVWMSGIEDDDTTTEVNEGETNLYITVGKVNAQGETIEQVPLKVMEDCDLDAWYRLTIKSIGNIFESDSGLAPRAGFLVYINGEQVSCEAAKGLVAAPMTKEAAGYMAAGQLFTAIDNTDAIFTSVGFKGIGAIDDMILDDKGPTFAQTTTITVTVPTGVIATIGETVLEETGTVELQRGPFTVVYTAAEGYILTGGTVSKDHNTNDGDVDDSKELDAKLVIVEVTYGGTDMVPYTDVTEAFTTIALYTQTPGATADVEFKQGSTNEYPGTTFDKGTYISISDDSDVVPEGDPLSSFWDISLGNVTFTKGLENNKKVTFSATDPDDELNGFTLTFEGVMKAGSQIITDSLAARPESITLDPTDCFVEIKGDWMTDPEISYKVVFAAVDGYEINEELITIDEETYTKYSLVPAAPAIEYVTFTVSYEATDVQNVTVTTNGETVVAVGSNYTVVSNEIVKITADPAAGRKDVKIVSDQVEIKDGEFKASKAATITISADEMVYATLPAITDSYTYNGTEQTAVLTVGKGYEVVDNSDHQKNAGVHQVEVALASGYDAWDDDDSVTNKFITWTINKAVVNVTAENVTIKVGDPKPTKFEAKVSPDPFGTDVIDYTVDCPTYEDKEGEYDIVVTPTPGMNPNYDVSVTPGKLKVEKAGPVIPEPEDLPPGEKAAYDDWYTSNPADPADVALNKPEDLKDAYLLGCKAGEAALEAARKEFKFASIAFVNGEWVATIKNSTGDSHEFYGNGAITVKSYSDVECKTEAENGNFFKAKLDYKTK